MLDLNHPQTQWIFAASREDDTILSLAKRMTLVPTAEREQVLARISAPIGRLQELNRKHFGASELIDQAISDLEAGCQTIAKLHSLESRVNGKGNCPVCNTRITNLPGYKDMIYCETCLDNIRDARGRLDSEEGFGTWAI